MISRVENVDKRDVGQAGREEPQGRELKMGIIYVTIQIVPTDMICRVEQRGQARREVREVQLGRELKMGIIHVTIQIVPCDMICRVEYVDKRDARYNSGRELKIGIIHVTIQIVPTDMICRVENVDKRDERDHRDEN